jgi:hypothetical protein
MWCTFFDHLFLCFSLQTPVKKWSKQSLILTTIHLWSFAMPPDPHTEWLRPSWPWLEAGTASCFLVSCAWVTKHSEWVLAILVKCFKSKVLSKLFIKSFYLFSDKIIIAILHKCLKDHDLKRTFCLTFSLSWRWYCSAGCQKFFVVADTVLLDVRSFLLLWQCYNRRPTYCIA